MTARSLYPDVPATECRLGFRPKCLICGGDILASSACCCLAACLYSLDTTRRLSVIPAGLVKTFTAFSNCSTNLAPRLRWWSTASGALWKVLAKGQCQRTN